MVSSSIPTSPLSLCRSCSRACLSRMQVLYPNRSTPSDPLSISSLANLKLSTCKSAAPDQLVNLKLIPSLHAIDSITSGSTMPQSTNAEAPIKRPSSSLAIVAVEAMDTFLDKAASTLILMTPEGGAIHAGCRSCTRAYGCCTRASSPNSDTSLSTKLCVVDRGL
jgi:hypothetical protein